MVLARKAALHAVSTASARPSVGAMATATRALHTSRSVHDAHSSAHSNAHGEQENYPTEGFSAPIWRWTFLGALAFAGVYRWTSTRNIAAPASQADQDGEDDEAAAAASLPWVTRYLQYHVTNPSLWKERSDRHIEGVRAKAEEKLLFQDAERPAMQRYRFAGALDQASPDRLPVGGTVDVSDVKIQRS